jgi:uncharacterized protein YecE (DUF72 family)
VRDVFVYFDDDLEARAPTEAHALLRSLTQ